jgi:hypothetical protein
VFENWVLRGIFGARRDGVTGVWRKLHNEELNDLYCSSNIVIIIIIINRKGWAIWPVLSPQLQLLSPAFLRSPNCSLSLWTVVV